MADVDGLDTAAGAGARMSNSRHSVVALAYSVPSGPTRLASASAMRPSMRVTVASARTRRTSSVRPFT
ncbi:hypothetical protein ACEN9J_09250 [Variovorax sp. Varisp41]|uniref:hypothetical protein n=1 Tax=Variovorax sp. Varisp41 TaxID=3243033 RepID=UPI0039B5662B